MHKRAGCISLLITANDLLNLLFVGLTDSLIDAQRFLSEKRYFDKAQSVSKAQKILGVLRDTLDFDIGGDLADVLAQLGADGGRRRLLDQLLVAALDAAVALAQVDDVAVLVGQDL